MSTFDSRATGSDSLTPSETSAASNGRPIAPAETPATNVPAGPVKKRRSVVPWALGALALLIAGGLFLRGRGGEESPGGPGAAARAPGGAGPGGGAAGRVVRVQSVVPESFVERLTLTGQLRTNQNVQLNARVSGRVAAVLVDEGQRVQRGQIVVRLEDDEARQGVESARANLNAALVRLDQTRLNLPSREAQLRSAVDGAQAALQSARAQVGAAQARYQQALLSEPARITTAQSQVESARAQIDSARSRVASARETARQTQLQVEAGMQAAQASLDGARAQLDQVRSGARDQEVARARAQVAIAEAQVRDAQTGLDRQRVLFEGGATARANVDTARTGFEIAAANLEAARQNLSLVSEGARTQEVRAAEEVVAGREAALLQAQAERSRVPVAQGQVTDALASLTQAQESLRQSQAGLSQIPITRQETRTALEAVRQAQAGQAQAESALQQARANLSQLPGIRADVPAAQAAVDQARAALEGAQINLGATVITSPISGVVNAKNVEVGQSASPGAPLLNIVALDDVYFEAQVPETQIARVQLNQPARVTIAAVSPEPLTGFVSEIIPIADERLRQFRVRISLPEAPPLTPGAFARGELQTSVSPAALTVPSELVRSQDGEQFLFVAVPAPAPAPASERGAGQTRRDGPGPGREEGQAPGQGAGQGDAQGRGAQARDAQGRGETARVERRRVLTGGTAGGRTEILGGLQPGDRVIEGNLTLEDGETVRLAPQTSA